VVYMNTTSLCGLTADEIHSLIGFDLGHAQTVANCIYKKRINDIHLFPGISKRIKEELNARSYSGLYKPVSSETSADGTIKYLYRNESGQEFETVYLPDNKRNTVCISSQAGCRMGCPFCVTGTYGFRGDLSVQDMLNQIISLPESGRITHVVFMGMGEPMDNINNVLKACNILTAEWGFSMSSRNITVSTVGIISGVETFLSHSNCNLTLSLYSPFPKERYSIVPAEKKYPAGRIIDIMKNHKALKQQRMSVAYVMIRGINDTDNHLDALKKLMEKSNIRINLIPYHPIPGDKNASSSAERMQYFKHELIISGISASIRKSRGADISAACGLLASGLKL
jgi:23S rRNA (adenine2503-C2)-methyltransferase